MRLRLTAFGAPLLTLDGAPAPSELTWRKHFGLLVYLARSPGRTRRRDHLIGLLWPDKDDARARHSLNEAVRAIRRAAGETALETRGDAMALPPDALEADWTQVERALADGDETRLLPLWRGEFLEGFEIPDSTAFEDWLAAERLEWRRRFRDTLTGCAATHVAQGRHRDALGVLERVLRAEPLAEAAVQLAMTAEAMAGAAPAALARYEAYAARLRDDRSAEPAAELARLAERIRLGLRAPAPVVPIAEVALPPLVGRTGQLAALAPYLPNPKRTGAAVVLVSGPAGCGRSRLVREATERARLEGARVVATTCVAADGEAAWSTLRTLLARGLAGAPGLAAAPPAALAALAELDPAVAQRYPGVRPRSAGSGAEMGRALGEALAAVADEEPLVVALDDAHLADDATLAALPAVLRAAERAPLLLMLAARLEEDTPEPLVALRARIGHDLAGVEVRTAPLDDPGLERLSAAMLPAYGDQERARLVRRLRTETGGVPLFVVEILRALAGAGTDAPGPWPLAGQTTAQPLPFPIPGAAVAALTLRVQRLSDRARRVLLAAAVTGSRVDEPLAAVLAGEPGDLDAALAELEHAGFLRDEGAVYHFPADIVRAFIEAELLSGTERRRLHRQAAELLERRGAAGDLAYAEHRFAAGEWAIAAETAAAVARAATERGATRLASRAARLARRAEDRLRQHQQG